MSKKNDTIVQGILGTLKNANKNITENTTENIDDINKSTRGRKKKTQETSVKFSGKKVIISKINDAVAEKKNKTFYIDTKYINMIENLAERCGMTTSELAEIAIQLLNNNLELEGFEE